MTELPCKNCLVLTQCKARLYKSGVESSTHKGIFISTYGITGMCRKENCERLADYICDKVMPVKKERIKEGRRFFNLKL